MAAVFWTHCVTGHWRCSCCSCREVQNVQVQTTRSSGGEEEVGEVGEVMEVMKEVERMEVMEEKMMEVMVVMGEVEMVKVIEVMEEVMMEVMIVMVGEVQVMKLLFVKVLLLCCGTVSPAPRTGYKSKVTDGQMKQRRTIITSSHNRHSGGSRSTNQSF